MHLTFQSTYIALNIPTTWKTGMQQERGFNLFVRSLEDNPTAFTYLDNLKLLCNHAIHLRAHYIRAWVESLNLQIWRVRCLHICQDFIQHSKQLRAYPILELSMVWASIKWSCLKWDIKGGIKFEFESLSSNSRLFHKSSRVWVFHIDQELAVVVPHGIHQGGI